jgi:hypothetical protein
MINAVIGYRDSDVCAVQTLFELDGLAVHRSIIKRKPTQESLYTVSSVHTGCAVVVGCDTQERAIECCRWLVAECEKIGDSFNTVTHHLRDKPSDRRSRLLKIQREAIELFIEDDDDCY